MNILHLATTYPLHEADSSAAFVEALCEALCRRGHVVHVLLPAHPELELRRGSRQAVLHSFSGTPIKSWHPWGYAQALTADRALRWDAYLAAPFSAVSAARALRRIMRETSIDVVHANWLLPAGPIVAAALWRTEMPMVVSCHGSGVFLAEKRRWAAAAARWGLKRSAAVTACSRDLNRRVGGLGAGPVPVWIPYGVDIDRFQPPTSDQRAAYRATLSGQHGVSAEAPWILAIGRLVHKKGFDVLVRAVAKVRARVGDAQLIIAGDGPLLDELQRRAVNEGVANAVHFVGPVAHENVSEWYGAADLIVVPSVHDAGGNVDGLPNVFLEGLASGTAVVASRVGGIPDIGRDGETVALVTEGDVNALGATIADLLEDDGRRVALGRAARADAEARLDWDNVAQRFEELYESVLNA